MQTYNFIVSLENTERLNMRIDAFLNAQLSDISREKIKKAIQNAQCQVDGLVVRSAGTKLKLGQCVELTLEPPALQLTAEDGEVEILFEDEHLLICHKQAGLTVHPCPSCPSNTLIQRLAFRYPTLLLQEGLRPGIVHRLDKDTSGLLVVALTEGARLQLSESFAARTVHKEYLALVQGIIEESGEIALAIGRHPTIKVKMAAVPENKGGKAAKSAWQRLYADPNGLFSLVKVTIFSGRTHQIRVHMAELGHALFGDSLYASSTQSPEYTQNCKRQMLHAWHLAFTHPINHGQCDFYCEPPEDFFTCALNLTHKVKKIIITGLAGCGKSSLLQIFAGAGIATFSADAVVAQLYAVGGGGHSYFYKRFQTRFMEHKKAPINRQTLRLAMQEDAHLRHEVECVIHGLVREQMTAFWQECHEKNLDFAVAEIPLYLENGWKNREKAHIVGVSCAQNIRHARLYEHRQWDAQHCQTIDAWQWPEEKKMAACDTIIANDANLEDLEKRAQAFIHELEKNITQRKQSFYEHLQSLCAPNKQ